MKKFSESSQTNISSACASKTYLLIHLREPERHMKQMKNIPLKTKRFQTLHRHLQEASLGCFLQALGFIPIS